MIDFDVEKYIHESNLIENIDDPEFDKQGLVAWNILKECEELNHSTIRKTQKIITLRQKDLMPHQRGYYRDLSKQEVWIGGKQAPSSSMTRHLMENWLLDYSKNAKDPIIAHIRFEKIHPFVDGNGRTGRMLLWWHEIKNGDVPTLFLNSEKFEKYYPIFGS